jgi:hypothetical protein
MTRRKRSSSDEGLSLVGHDACPDVAAGAKRQRQEDKRKSTDRRSKRKLRAQETVKQRGNRLEADATGKRKKYKSVPVNVIQMTRLRRNEERTERHRLKEEERRKKDRSSKRRTQESAAERKGRLKEKAADERKRCKSLPVKALRGAQKRCSRQQQSGERKDREVELVQEMEEGYDDPAFMPSAEHLALAEHSVIAAQMAVAYTSGFSEFESGNDLPDMPAPGPERERLLNPDLPLSDMPDRMRKVCEELDALKERLRKGKNECLRKFQKHAHQEQPMMTCVCCGRREVTSEPDLHYPYVTLRQMKGLELTADDSKLKKWLALDPKYKPARAIHEGMDGKFYNILSGGFIETCNSFGELADRQRGRVCLQYCLAKVKAGKVPDVCIRRGFDLTHLSAIGLHNLTLAEKAVIALTRVYVDVVKLTSIQGITRSGIRGSVVAFDHNAVEKFTAYVHKQGQMLPNVDAALETVCVIMLGTKDKQDFIKGAMKSPCLQVI